jgi:hypothetical protein
MSVGRAYITSLWTTGILVAASILLLAMTSAIVAFDGWPGDVSGAAVDRVPVVAPRAAAERAFAAPSAGASGTAAGPAIETVRVGAVALPGSRPDGGRAPVGGHAPARTPVATSGPDSHAGAARPLPPDPPAPAPRREAPRPGDPIRSTGATVGGAVGSVDPAIGRAVMQVSNTAADVVDAVAAPPPAGAGL